MCDWQVGELAGVCVLAGGRACRLVCRQVGEWQVVELAGVCVGRWVS